MDAKHYSDLLKKAMRASPDLTLPKKTQEEHAVGRGRLMRHLRESIVDVGVDELRVRFGGAVAKPGGLEFKENAWMVSVHVSTAAKTNMGFEEPLLDFPSDHMIAQIALVVDG